MIVSTATLRGDGRKNQDAIVVTDRAAAVLDGASAWYPQEPGRDGGWYSENLGARLMTTLDDDRPLADIVHDAIANMCTTFDLKPGSAPESTLTIARWNDRHVEVFALCDSPAIIYGTNGNPTIVLDDRLQSAGTEARAAYRAHLRAGHGYGSELRPFLAKLQEDEFKHQNREGGYWVAEATPEAAHHAFTARFELDQVQAILLLSDGAAARVDEYAQPSTWQEACSRAVLDPASFIAEVHQIEDTDPDGQRWPRAKCHDDKAIVVIRPSVSLLPIELRK